MPYKRTACGLCGKPTRHVGSHVLSDHLPYFSTTQEARAALIAERAARYGKA